MTQSLSGLWPPVATPFRADGTVDEDRFVHHSRRLLDEGAHGLAILGTTSEANSLTLDERRRVIDCLIEDGIPAGRLLPGTGACAIGDAVTLSRHAARNGCAGVLLLPPFYYKGVPDEGLFAYVASLVEQLAGDALPILLYHIPPMAIVGWSADLIGRLRDAFPDIVVGIKDSSGDFEHTTRLISSFPGFRVFPGSEARLRDAMGLGAAGCITATANVNAAGLRALVDGWDGPDGERLQREAADLRTTVQKVVLILAVKAILAERYGDPGWRAVRPPLIQLDEGERAALLREPAVAALLDQAQPRANA